MTRLEAFWWAAKRYYAARRDGKPQEAMNAVVALHTLVRLNVMTLDEAREFADAAGL
jgi:hypothetical protein